jgi:hypothetical protein
VEQQQRYSIVVGMGLIVSTLKCQEDEHQHKEEQRLPIHLHCS